MSKRLILIRHAKSSWDDPFADDHARVLNSRGEASAQAIGAWMATKGYTPETVLCSDAIRTRQTAELILAGLAGGPKLRLSSVLYHAAPDTMEDVLRRETADTIAVIAHNPSIGILANFLVETAPDHRRFADYPTCATTVIDFEVDTWAGVERGSGHCADFIVPRDLIGTAGNDMG